MPVVQPFGGFYSQQELSYKIGKETEFETLQLEGEIAEDVIKNIENSKNNSKNSPLDTVQAQNLPFDTAHT
jgi:hypothetical protein